VKKPIGLAMLVVGVILLVWGFNASESVGSEISRFFSGNPTDRTMWLLVGGAGGVAAGLALLLLPTKAGSH
jgi:hypothetical protein